MPGYVCEHARIDMCGCISGFMHVGKCMCVHVCTCVCHACRCECVERWWKRVFKMFQVFLTHSHLRTSMKYLLFHLGLYELHEVSNVVFSCRSAGDFPGSFHHLYLTQDRLDCIWRLNCRFLICRWHQSLISSGYAGIF